MEAEKTKLWQGRQLKRMLSLDAMTDTSGEQRGGAPMETTEQDRERARGTLSEQVRKRAARRAQQQPPLPAAMPPTNTLRTVVVPAQDWVRSAQPAGARRDALEASGVTREPDPPAGAMKSPAPVPVPVSVSAAGGPWSTGPRTLLVVLVVGLAVGAGAPVALDAARRIVEPAGLASPEPEPPASEPSASAPANPEPADPEPADPDPDRQPAAPDAPTAPPVGGETQDRPRQPQPSGPGMASPQAASPHAAVDALLRGDRAGAMVRYQRLARRFPQMTAYAEAARILAVQRGGTP